MFTFSLLAGGDAVTTCVGLARGHQELNGILGDRPTCTRVVLTKTAVVAGVIGGAEYLKGRGRSRWAKVALWAGIGANAFAVGWNVYQLNR